MNEIAEIRRDSPRDQVKRQQHRHHPPAGQGPDKADEQDKRIAGDLMRERPNRPLYGGIGIRGEHARQGILWFKQEYILHDKLRRIGMRQVRTRV